MRKKKKKSPLKLKCNQKKTEKKKNVHNSMEQGRPCWPSLQHT